VNLEENIARQTRGALAYYQFTTLHRAGIAHGLFTRLGGVSEGPWASLNLSIATGDAPERVHENRRRALAALDLDRLPVATTWMTHSNAVFVVDAARASNFDALPQADALITRQRGVVLELRFADCLPVLFFDQRRGAIGLAHAGWRGIVNGVLLETAHAMHRAFGTRAEDLWVGIGPGIGPARFEVGAEVARAIAAASDEAALHFDTTHAQWHADLWLAAEQQLRRLGVCAIETLRLCTASNTHEWFSHRAERGRTGRFGVFLALT